MVPIGSSSVVASARGRMSRDRRDADRIVVWLRGQHDISTVAALSETMDRATALDDADVVVDLSLVVFIDAATVGVILRTREFLRLRSRSLTVRSPSTSARRVLDICGLTGLVDSHAVDTTHMTGTAGALGTFVAVPATARLDPCPDGSAAKPRAAPSPNRAGRVNAASRSSTVKAGYASDERDTNLAGRGRP